MKRITILAAVCSLLLVTGCGSDDEKAKTTAGANGQSNLPQRSEPVAIDPADFTTRVDNPYWPIAPDGEPGRKWVYRAGKERVEITVTDKKKTVEGVKVLVLHDVATEDGKLVEDTDDWFAQDNSGNIWYFGNDTKEYEEGKVVSTKGSFESGIDGGAAGVIVPGNPRVGLTYRQEYSKGEAEDRARVLSLDAKVEVPFGSFDNALETRDTTPLEPNLAEHKYYAKGVGPVLTTTEGGGAREELVNFTR